MENASQTYVRRVWNVLWSACEAEACLRSIRAI